MIVRSSMLMVALLAVAWCPAPWPATAAEPDRAGIDFFETRIRPVLVQHCYECHSEKAAAERKLKGGLLLDSRDGLLKGGDSGEVIVAGKPDSSPLLEALRHGGDIKMPPKGKLPDAVLADFAKWIELGAPDPRSGSAAAGVRTIDVEAGRQYWAFRPLAPVTPPAVKNAAWVRTDIDRFILAELEKKSLAPNPPANKERLIRRAALELCGLPPTPAEIDAFLADESPEAFAKVVDGLLDSPRYGERWARHWLDIARFAESGGYEFDGDRQGAFHYRDYVIRAFNDDQPYDEFVRWQIAGDHLRKGEFIPATATGYLVAGPYPGQTTAKTIELIRYNLLDDMVSTIGTSLLGLSVGCARCHAHKYDPIAQEDYYRLIANLSRTDSTTAQFDLEPEANSKLKAEFDAAHAPLAAALARFETEEFPGRFAAWLANRPTHSAPPTLGPWQHLGPFPAESFDKAFDEPFPPEKKVELTKTYLDGKLQWKPQPDWSDGQVHNTLTGDNAANYLFRTIESTVDATVVLSLGSDDAIKVWINGKQVVANKASRGAAADQEKPTLPLKKGRNELLMKIVNGAGPSGFYFALTASGAPPQVAALLEMPPGQWNDKQRQQVLDWYKTVDERWIPLNNAVVEHKKQEPKPKLTPAFVAQSNRGGPAYFLIRGEVERKREQAQPGFVHVLTAPAADDARWLTAAGQANSPAPVEPRVALANWLTDTEHGAGNLLARVIVNRLWQHHFGRGLVATPNDFGTRGEPPTHPELLDWLAGELVRSGWKLKAVHKQIVTSAVYMQASDAHAAGLKTDPQNRLLWHHPVRRLEAEILRDAILYVSGTLDETMYGPGTLDQNSSRRSIYLTVKRSRLVPWMQAFDAPDAIQSLGSRAVTTVPAQSLALMNSPLVRTRAEKLAQRVAGSPPRPLAESLTDAFRITLGRRPNDAEHAELLAFGNAQADSYGPNGQATALADVCQLLLCMNEFAYID